VGKRPSPGAHRRLTTGACRIPLALTCEHLFVTSQGTVRARFERFLRQGNVQMAEDAARELGALSLRDALLLVALYARQGSRKFEPAAVRWVARLARERDDVQLQDLLVAVAALAQLRGEQSDKASRILSDLTHR
jgi:hypothetical protein